MNLLEAHFIHLEFCLKYACSHHTAPEDILKIFIVITVPS